MMNFRKTLMRCAVGAMIAGMAGLASGADHRDSPRLMANIAFEGNIDINDVYLFQSPTTKSNTVMIMTLSPAAGVIGPGLFHPGALYEIRIQNTSSLADNLAFQFTFSNPDAFNRQAVQLVKQTAKGQPLATVNGVAPQGSLINTVMAFGSTGSVLPVKGGGSFTAAVFDDPFFFDLNAFNHFVTLAKSGASLAQRTAPFFPPNVPSNFFGTFNVLAVVLEVPTSSLLSSSSNPKLGLWARTVFNGEQVDRMARPAINTAAIPSELKNVFNIGTPFTDAYLFTPGMIEDLTLLYGISNAYAFTLAQTLLPDLLTIDTSKPSGFLNGRKLEDDVIDAEFSLLTNGALKSDRVGNDSVFRKTFPYLGVAMLRPAHL